MFFQEFMFKVILVAIVLSVLYGIGQRYFRDEYQAELNYNPDNNEIQEIKSMFKTEKFNYKKNYNNLLGFYRNLEDRYYLLLNSYTDLLIKSGYSPEETSTADNELCRVNIKLKLEKDTLTVENRNLLRLINQKDNKISSLLESHDDAIIQYNNLYNRCQLPNTDESMVKLNKALIHVNKKYDKLKKNHNKLLEEHRNVTFDLVDLRMQHEKVLERNDCISYDYETLRRKCDDLEGFLNDLGYSELHWSGLKQYEH